MTIPLEQGSGTTTKVIFNPFVTTNIEMTNYTMKSTKKASNDEWNHLRIH